MTDTLAVPLSTELRARTAGAHDVAETATFFADLSTGRVTPAQVGALLAALLPVYEALETAAALWRDDPLVQPLLVPGLERAERLRADVAALGATGALPRAAMDYAARVAQTASRRPAFVAHHYTRYLGDLSGGQVIRRALQRELGLEPAFFVFDGLRPGAVKQDYRAALDALPLTADQREELVAEALVAYRLNVALTAELDADLARWTTS